MPMSLERTLSALRAIGEPTRLRMLALLSRGELTVSELVQVLGQSQPRVSRHLKLMAEAGVVERMPEGAWVFYGLMVENPQTSLLVEAVVSAIPEDDPTLARDLTRLAEVKIARRTAAEAYFRIVAQDWDRIRGLHMASEHVEQAMREVAGPGPFDLMVDIGTGTGRVLEVFADTVRRGVGIDLSHEMLTVARANLERAGLSQCSVRHADLFALPFPASVARLVTIHQVLHYLEDPSRAVLEATRLLAPGGRLMIVDFAPHGLEFLRDDHAHRRLGFADREVEKWADAGGLRFADVRTLAADEDGLTVKIWLAERSALGGVEQTGDAA